MSSFYEYQANGDKEVEKPQPQETVVQKKDIVVGENKDSTSENNTEDDSPSVLNLRNLFRQNKIDKSQYVGGLATLVATGLITKSEFTRLKAAAN